MVAYNYLLNMDLNDKYNKHTGQTKQITLATKNLTHLVIGISSILDRIIFPLFEPIIVGQGNNLHGRLSLNSIQIEIFRKVKHKYVSSMALKPTNIRRIRTDSQQY